MIACSFFGHRNVNYFDFQEKLKSIIVDLIVNKNVNQFFNGYRGNFDYICARMVWELKAQYKLHNSLVLSYLPQQNNKFELPKYFDDSIYLLEKRTLPKFAIIQSNRAMIDSSSFVVFGINHNYGGAYTAYNYALKKKKTVFNIFE